MANVNLVQVAKMNPVQVAKLNPVKVGKMNLVQYGQVKPSKSGQNEPSPVQSQASCRLREWPCLGQLGLFKIISRLMNCTSRVKSQDPRNNCN